MNILQVEIYPHYCKFKCQKMTLAFRKFEQMVSRMWGIKLSFKILILLNIYGSTVAELTCHQCQGINCLRTTYKATQKCVDDLDICVTVFNGQTVVAQGCLQQLSEEFRGKCYTGIEEYNQDSTELNECFKCNENLCNNLASETFECIQCDFENHSNCHSKPESLKPTRCLISRTPNEYCFVNRVGERIIRGCSNTLEEQINCLSSEDCMLCQASEIRGCNVVDLPKNDMESSGSGSDNSSSGSEAEGESSNGSEDGGTDGSVNDGSDSNPGDGNTGNEDSGSDSSGFDNENNGNGNNSSQVESTESGGGSNGNSITIANSYIYILTLNICLLSTFVRK